MTVTMRTRKASPHACECSFWGTGCTKQIPRLFAQGHDARLKSLLIQAGVADQKVTRTVDGQAETLTAQEAASRFGFGWMVLDAIQTRLGRASRLAAAKATAKTQKPAEKPRKDQRRAAQIKIGRWKFDAGIDPKGTAFYLTKSGQAREAAAGTYTEL